jgi:hypothetical protein
MFVKTENGDEPDYPIEIPFEEYSLEGTSCGWTGFDPNTVIVVNSDEELYDYIECTGGSYPEIDFADKTLLLVRGGATNGIVSIAKHFIQTAANAYSFNIDIILDETDVAQGWIVAILIPKMIDEAVVELNVNFNSSGTAKKWLWTMADLTVTLEFYPAEGKYYSTVDDNLPNGIHSILFQNDTWMYYKTEGNMMYIRGENEEFPNENDLYNKWFILQHTEEVLELEYAGYLPAVPVISKYLFTAQN